MQKILFTNNDKYLKEALRVWRSGQKEQKNGGSLGQPRNGKKREREKKQEATKL